MLVAGYAKFRNVGGHSDALLVVWNNLRRKYFIIRHIHSFFIGDKQGWDGVTYRWIGNYEELKSFIENAIKLSGTWSSPGGEINNFKAGDKFSIKWHRYKSKKIILSKDDNAELLSKNFKAFANLAWLLDLSSKPLNRRIRRVFLTFLHSFLVSKNILRQTNPMNAIAV